MKITRAMPTLLILSLSATSVNAQDLANEVSELRQLLMTVQANYDARISDLEERLARAERQSRSAQRDADEAIELAEHGIFVTDGDYYAFEVMKSLGHADSGGLVRLGFVHYNTEDEVDQTLSALDGFA